jgi:thioredoxin reductase (NADPH)
MFVRVWGVGCAAVGVGVVVTAEEIAGIEVFAMLGPDEQERLARVSADVSLVPGEYAANEGDDRALFAVLEGRIETVKLVDGSERVVGERLPGDVFGEVPIVLGTVFPVGFRAVVQSRVLRISPADYHAIAAVDPILPKAIGALASLRMTGARGLQAIAAD